MRAKRVHKDCRVQIIAGTNAHKFGTIEAINGTLISVRPDGEKRGFIYSANELKLIKKIA